MKKYEKKIFYAQFNASHSVPSLYLNKHFLPMVPLKIIDKILEIGRTTIIFKEECRIFELWCDFFCKLFGIRVYVFISFEFGFLFSFFDGIVQTSTKLSLFLCSVAVENCIWCFRQASRIYFILFLCCSWITSNFVELVISVRGNVVFG